MHKVRPTWIAAKHDANTSSRSANAPGSADAITMASITTPNSMPRMRSDPGLNQFVAHAVYCHPSQTANHITSVCSAPSRLRWSSR